MDKQTAQSKALVAKQKGSTKKLYIPVRATRAADQAAKNLVKKYGRI